MYNFSLADNLITEEEYKVLLRCLRNEFKKGISIADPEHLQLTAFYLYTYSVTHDLDLVRWLRFSSKESFDSCNRRIQEKVASDLLYFLAEDILGSKPAFDECKVLLDRVKLIDSTVELSCIEPHISLLMTDNDSDIKSKYIFDYVRLYCHLFDEENLLKSLHRELEKIKDKSELVLGIFSKYIPYSRNAYSLYIDFCNNNSLSTVCQIDNLDDFFGSEVQISLPSKYREYFPQLDDFDARAKTVICFESIYEGLIEKGFLNKDCERSAFLWALGLSDKRPERFRRIAFHSLTATNNREIGNSAFQCFLLLIGFSKDEIKSLRSKKNKKNDINELFVLTVDRRTSFESKDEPILKEIIKSSGLPVKME